MVPTLAEWRAQTSSVIEARRGSNNPEIKAIDRLLWVYGDDGRWPFSIVPLFDILKTIATWDKRRRGQRTLRCDSLEERRRGQNSKRTDAFENLWDSVIDHLNSRLVFVYQNEYAVVGPEDPQRFLVTTGILSCIAVGLCHTDLNIVALGHLKQSNAAQTSVEAMVDEFTKRLQSADTAWAGNKIRAVLCGGRHNTNDAKCAAIEDALLENGIPAVQIKRFNCLRTGENLIHLAIDRSDKSHFLFTEQIDAQTWPLRSSRAMGLKSQRTNSDQFFAYEF